MNSRHFTYICLTQGTCAFSVFRICLLDTRDMWILGIPHGISWCSHPKLINGAMEILEKQNGVTKKNEITIFFCFLQIAHFRYKSRSFRGKSHSFLGSKLWIFWGKNWNLLDWLHWWCSGTSLQRPKLWHDGWVLEPHRKLPWCQSFPLGIPVDRQLKFLFKAPKVFNG